MHTAIASDEVRCSPEHCSMMVKRRSQLPLLGRLVLQHGEPGDNPSLALIEDDHPAELHVRPSFVPGNDASMRFEEADYLLLRWNLLPGQDPTVPD